MTIVKSTAAAVVAAGAFLASGSAAADAAVTCAYNGTTATVTVTMTDYGDAKVGKSAGGAIQLDGASCGGATGANTNAIQVVGDDTSQTLELDLTNPLGPGKTAEANAAASEIEVNAVLGGGYDTLRLIGNAAANTWTFGTGGANLNADGDGDDVRWSGMDRLELQTLANNDVISLAGSPATGSPLNKQATIFAGQGGDKVTGGANSDYVYGDADEQYAAPATGGIDVINGGQGSDTLIGGPNNDTLSGQDGGDQICGGMGNDTLNGNAGDDAFEFNYVSQCNTEDPDGADVYTGGSGSNDQVSYYERSQNVRVTLDNVANDGADTNSPPDGTANELDNVKANVERVDGGSGNDVMDATSAAATAVDGSNDFQGNDGNDTLKGGVNRDFLEGGDGNDTIDGGDETDSIYAGDDLDTVTGGEGDDYLDGGAGKDSVSGGPGDDRLPQGSSTDNGDVLSGGDGTDEVDYGSRSSNTRVSLDNVANDGADVNQDGVAEEADNVKADIENVSTGTGKDFINGNTAAANAAALNNYFDGSSGQDTLDGGAGEDRLFGQNDADTLTGGAGEDELDGGYGADKFSAKDGDFDRLDAGSGDGATDTATFDAFDERLYFP